MPWAWRALALLGLLVVVVGVGKLFRSRASDAREKALADLTATAQTEEQSGQLGLALQDYDAALALAREFDRPTSARLVDLNRRRDQISRREAEERLSTTATADPDRSISECVLLLARARTDPALASLEDAIRQRLEQSRKRSAETVEADARRALDAGHSPEALALSERLFQIADDMEADARQRIQAEARDLAVHVVERQGAILETVQGRFTLGTAASYTSAMHPLIAGALRQRGYLTRPASSPWLSLWDELAPFRLTIEVEESQGSGYLQSANKISHIEARLTLSRRGEPAPTWQGALSASTRTPMTSLTPVQSSQIEMGNRPDPALERLLYDNARATLIERLGPKLGSLPAADPGRLR